MAERGQTRSNGGWDRFQAITHLANHWNRPIGPRSFYWYLTFETSNDLKTLAARYQKAIQFPYYDLVPLHSLHITLDRVAFEDAADSHMIETVRVAAQRECKRLTPFSIEIQSVSGTPGAIGFDVHPDNAVRDIRDRLRNATLSVNRAAPTRGPEFDAHIAIAYCNSDGVSTTETIEAIRSLGPMRPVVVTMSKASLVLLERRTRSYHWKTISQVTFSS
ncbi:2'-5' RNA ligase family protein [Paractinoplanes rishiriensis]|uniref:2'-5' RNA ligase n=1 Tax=Paractinoplanes rishiriensis TaxID=1050105 RepID=A0A919MY70_9ACTN|nr:2'-5' RNA ligase family protein [Actinoplanes rishiriensis]GIE99818.1 hypothetical protein Ari01nite_72830 [Actinoplanes rishiriensis]